MVSPAQVYVVIPAYNEGPLISRVVGEVRRAGYTAVVVDDGSSDTTAQQAGAAGATVITHLFNLCQGAALQTGMADALTQRAEVIVTFDADGQHRVSDISRLTDALVQERADFALRQPLSRPSAESAAAAALAAARGNHLHAADHRPRA